MEVVSKVALIFVATIFFAHGARKDWSLEGVVLRTEKLVCDINPMYGNIKCSTKTKSRNVTHVNMNLTLSHKVETVTYNIKTFYQFSNNEYRPMLIDSTMDFCKNQKGIEHSPLHAAFKKTLITLMNVYEACPFLPGKVYYIKDWNFVASDLPSLVPAGRYVLKAQFFGGHNEYALTFAIYFRVENYGILDLKVG
ncbi:hypothetical protein Bhyg_12965 [Pseudolycoriella hygida]|nr:hypothetical protein Bhyg_12965 [Pseudolycoriella hygida]